MEDKLTLEQFGATVRLKYPEYSKYSNKEIGIKMVEKYPQYKQVVSDLVVEEPKSLIRKIGDLFTSGTQKFGETIGQVVATPEVSKITAEADILAGKTEANLVKAIREAKLAGRDTSRLEKQLNEISGRQSVQETIKGIVPSITKTPKQVVGEAVQTGAEALSGGVISGVRGIGLSKVAPTAAGAAATKASFLAKPLTGKLADIGVKTAKNVATIAPFGYAFDVAQNLQEDASGASIFKPGMGTLVSSVVPLAIGGVQAGRQLATPALSKVIAPNLSGIPSGAYERLKNGEVTKFIGKVTPEQALDDARTSASAFKSAVYKQFGEGKEQIITEFTGKRIGLQERTAKTLRKIAERFGFDDRLPQNMQNMSAKEVMDLLENINSIRPASELDDPLVRSLKFNLGDIKSDLMSRATKEFGGKGGMFEKLYQDYAIKKSKLKDIQAIIGKIGIKPGSVKLNPVQHQTATRRLQKVFNDDANGYFRAIKVLEEETGENILDKIAASQLSRITPKSFRVNVSSAPGVNIASRGVLGILDDIVSVVTFPLSSPRVGQWIIRKVGGYDQSIATKLLNASPSVRSAIYNAVHKENMAFSDAVELYAKDYIKNPKLGLSIEDVSKNAYKGETDLTTKILKDLEGKTTVSKQYILDATNRGELKQVERDLIRQALEKEGATVNVADFAKKVKAELLPLNVKTTSNPKGSDPKFFREQTRGDAQYGGARMQPRYEMVNLPDELRGNVKNYRENIYESPIKTSAGQTHFSGATDNYFGHTRIEDMADNKTRRVIEVQSDLYQKGNLERERNPNTFGRWDDLDLRNARERLEYLEREARKSPARAKELEDEIIDAKIDVRQRSKDVDFMAERNKEIDKLAQYNDPTAHFRMIREEIKKAAQDGKTKLQFPTGETAMKIEGLGEGTQFRVGPENATRRAVATDIKDVGQEIRDINGDSWIITDVLGDGKFKAVPKDVITRKLQENGVVVDGMNDALSYAEHHLPDVFDRVETFDISGKVDTNNPIYKFYEKDMQKYLTKFGGKKVVDDKGVSWIEVPIKKEMAKIPVEAFGLVPFIPNKETEKRP